MSRNTSKLTQAAALLDYLYSHQTITVSEADRVLHIGDANGIIRDLRKKGWPILDYWETAEGHYGTSRFKRFFLADCADCIHYHDGDGCEYCDKQKAPLDDTHACRNFVGCWRE